MISLNTTPIDDACACQCCEAANFDQSHDGEFEPKPIYVLKFGRGQYFTTVTLCEECIRNLDIVIEKFMRN